MVDGEEDSCVGAGASGELVSPDSGMTTIRSSRSSKESSVFLSDDSPVGEGGGGSVTGTGGLFLRNPSPLGLPSLSPPVPPERRRHHSGKKKNDNFDLFGFDPLHGSDPSLPAGGASVSSGEKVDDKGRTTGSSSLSECEELSMLDLSAPDSLRGLESKHHGKANGNETVDTMVPPTPVNSLVGSRPSSSCGVSFFPEDVVERISCLQHKDSVSSSLSETWEELGFDTTGALSSYDTNTWSRIRGLESPLNVVEESKDKDSDAEMTIKESRERSGNVHQTGMGLEPQLSLITEQTESCDWSPDSLLKDKWNSFTLSDLQTMPPEEEGSRKHTGVRKTPLLPVKKPVVNTLLSDTSKEEDEEVQGRKGGRQMEPLDFWTYSAQKGFLKSDSGTTTSYPESLDMWNMTIRDDSLSPLTTPEDLSQYSGSFCVGIGTSVESPQGFPDGGMEMWNTTIQEDSSSTTSPEGLENEKGLAHRPWDAGDVPEIYVDNRTDDCKTIDVERDQNKVPSHTSEEMNWIHHDNNFKMVTECREDRPPAEETKSTVGQNDLGQNLESEHPKDGTSSNQVSEMLDLPVPGMVISTSHYDNVGADCWSLASSPETFTSPAVDLIQLDKQSSPFIAVTRPSQIQDERDQHQSDGADPEKHPCFSEQDQEMSQVFLFEYEQESVDGLEKSDLREPSNRSPFILVDGSVTQAVSHDYHVGPVESAENNPSPVKHSTTGSASCLPVPGASVDGLTPESKGGSNVEGNGVLEETAAGEAVSQSSSPGGERDTLKYSPDSLHPGSQDELRSNSDGDSSSGLEMEYIIVSGKVKDAETEWNFRPKGGGGQTGRARKSMETFSMLSHAATVLKAQAQAAHRVHEPNQVCGGADSQAKTESSHQSSCETPSHPQGNAGGVSDRHMDASLSKSTDVFQQSDSRPPAGGHSQTKEGNHDDKSNVMVRSASPSLRYPSDNFLKTREEVYVHSQISMEDSDEGGQSPCAAPSGPTSLGNVQVWGGHYERRDPLQSPCEPKSPILTDSSISHTSSEISSPSSGPDISTDRGLGLPFSGDLMEEDKDEEEQEEGADTELMIHPRRLREKEEKNPLSSYDLLSFTEELVEGHSCQQTYLETLEPSRTTFLQDTVGSCIGQPMRNVDFDESSVQQRPVGRVSAEENHSHTAR